MHLKSLIYRARLNGVPVYCMFLLFMYTVARGWSWWRSTVGGLPTPLRKYVLFPAGVPLSTPARTQRELDELATIVVARNTDYVMRNEQRFGEVHPDTTVIVVRVGRDVERLQYLIVSLAQVRYIQSTVVIFSHSFYDNQINELIKSINFCRIIQIFYPYSNQLYPHKFPGGYHTHCADKSCTERDALLMERKHHWWWQAYYVFRFLEWSNSYKGTVIFLEEDNYVLPDILYMLRFAKRSLAMIPGTSIICFGRPFTRIDTNQDLDYDTLVVEAWWPPFERGLAFNKTVWEKIEGLASHFCMFDDVSWSKSLQNLFSKFPGGHADGLVSLLPRVLTTDRYSSGMEAFKDIQTLFKDARYFPKNVKAALVFNSMGRVKTTYSLPSRGNGGWSDIRDHLLCLDPFSSTEVTTDTTKYMSTATTFDETMIQLNYSVNINNIMVED